MQIILLERVHKLGQMGEVVNVKDGYARNFLIPRGKALRATRASLDAFQAKRAQLEARNLEQKSEAEKLKAKVEGRTIVVLRQAGESGQLFGSVTARDIASGFTADGVTLSHSQVRLETPIKAVGIHDVVVELHPEVEVKVHVNVARTAEEADIQAGKAAPVAEEQTPAEEDEDDILAEIERIR